MKRSTSVGALAALLVAASAVAAVADRKLAQEPPPSPDLLVEGDCSVSISQVRANYPQLMQMLLTINFDHSEEVFKNPNQAVSYYLSENRAVSSMVEEGQRVLARGGTPTRYSEKAMKDRLKEEKRALKAETKKLKQEFSGPCRKTAWHALGGSASDETSIDATALAVDQAI